MGQLRHAAQPQSVRIESWEIEVAKSVARSFRTFTEIEDLEAELFKRLLELKARKRSGVRDWRSFLARSLYNAATDLIRRWNYRHRGMRSLTAPLGDEDDDAVLEDVLAAPAETVDLRIELSCVMRELAPELQELWHLLVEVRGNKTALARRLGRPRKTVDHWIGKIRTALGKRGFARPKK